jgi:hypothetical protein
MIFLGGRKYGQRFPEKPFAHFFVDEPGKLIKIKRFRGTKGIVEKSFPFAPTNGKTAR